MTIRRSAARRYSNIPNSAIEDSRLSFKALGLLTYLLSKPDHWTISREHLATTHTEGVEAVRSGLRELRDAGYILDEVERDEAGRIIGKAAVVYDEPQDQPVAPPPGGPPIRRETRQVAEAALVSTEGKQELNEVTTETPHTPHGQLALVADQPPPPRRRGRVGQLVGFDAFWTAYPRREAKGAARRAWEKAIRRANPQDIIIGAQRYAQDPNRDPQYTAHPATWLNADRWADDPLPQRSRTGAGGTVAAARRVMDATAGMTAADLTAPVMSGQAARVTAMLQAGRP